MKYTYLCSITVIEGNTHTMHNYLTNCDSMEEAEEKAKAELGKTVNLNSNLRHFTIYTLNMGRYYEGTNRKSNRKK